MSERKIIHLTRHAQAEHNVEQDYTIPDAKLTPLGKEQSAELYKITSPTYQKTAELLVSSPQRRPLQTLLIGYADLKSRLESQSDPKPVVILDILQEVNNHPCDTPTYPISDLKSDLGGIFADLDFSLLAPDYASKTGIFAPKNVSERATKVRAWLMARPEREIVVVAHGDILRHVADAAPSWRQWDNAENKTFTFGSDDPSQPLVELDSVEPKDATAGPTSSE